MRLFTPTAILVTFIVASSPPLMATQPPSEPAPDGASTESKETTETRFWSVEDVPVVTRTVSPIQPAEPVGVDSLRIVDDSTLKQLRRRREKLLSKAHPVGPALKFIVPVVATPQLAATPPTFVENLTRAPGDLTFFQLSTPSAAAPSGFSSTVNEPAVAAVGDFVFYTGNWYAASSTNGGDSFSFVNPFTGPFAPTATGFCCDQVVAYDPGTDTLFYLQQYISDGSTGVHRINVDQGANGTFECAYNVTPQLAGFATGNWADFPDLVAGGGFLYHSSNVFTTASDTFSGAFVIRYSIADMSQCDTVSLAAFSSTSFGSFKLSRGVTTTLYFASHISNSSLRIWSWPSNSNTLTSVDRAVTAWSNSARTCPGPDNRDWCGFIDPRMGGAYVADGIVGFMWVPSQDATFPFPYTRIARFSSSDLSLVDEPIIWNAEYAWVYPSVAVNGNGDLGGTILVGGGTSLFPSCSAWISDDLNNDVLQPLENATVVLGSTGPSQNRSGDYTSAIAYYPEDTRWAGGCFAYDSTTEGTSRYVLFGRDTTPVGIFADGFESGDTSAWSATVP